MERNTLWVSLANNPLGKLFLLNAIRLKTKPVQKAADSPRLSLNIEAGPIAALPMARLGSFKASRGRTAPSVVQLVIHKA